MDTFHVLSLILITTLQGSYYYHPQFAFEGTAAVEDMAKFTMGDYKRTKPVFSYLSAFLLPTKPCRPFTLSKPNNGDLLFLSLATMRKRYTCFLTYPRIMITIANINWTILSSLQVLSHLILADLWSNCSLLNIIYLLFYRWEIATQRG